MAVVMEFLPRRYARVDIAGGGPVLGEHPLPDFGGRCAVVVRPIVVGLCRADLKELKGARKQRRDFGHEIVGAVAWASADSPLRVGERVVFDPHVEVERTTGFGELMPAWGPPDRLQAALPRVPPSLPPERLVFVEPMACVHHCWTRILSQLSLSTAEGLTIAVVGAGNAGTLMGLLLKHCGARVKLFNRGLRRLDFLRQRGLFLSGEVGSFPSNPDADFDVVIPATSFLDEPVLQLSFDLAKPGGVVMLYGGTVEKTRLQGLAVDFDGIRRNQGSSTVTWRSKAVTVAGSYGARSEDFQAVVDLLERSPGDFLLERLISRRISLGDLPGVLQRILDDETDYFGKVVVEVRGDREATSFSL